MKDLQQRFNELKEYADRLAAALPIGMLPQDVENLRQANADLASEVDELRKLLQNESDYASYLEEFIDSEGLKLAQEKYRRTHPISGDELI